jgi:ABC-type lipoprotein release transport system permease subunit
MIKLIVAGVVALLTIIIVAAVINGANAKVTQSFERVYLRISNLSSDNYDNPITAYAEKIHDSNLRSYVDLLTSTISSSKTSLDGIIGTIGVKPEAISKEVSEAESANLQTLTSELEEGELSGTLDHVYASDAYYQITTLLQYEAEARKKTNNQQFADILDSSTRDLKILQENFHNWSNAH